MSSSDPPPLQSKWRSVKGKFQVFIVHYMNEAGRLRAQQLGFCGMVWLALDALQRNPCRLLGVCQWRPREGNANLVLYVETYR